VSSFFCITLSRRNNKSDKKKRPNSLGHNKWKINLSIHYAQKESGPDDKPDSSQPMEHSMKVFEDGSSKQVTKKYHIGIILPTDTIKPVISMSFD
jgi:hypothetical protein